MKMTKYLNKRIFVCLSLALIFLVAASFVASSVEAQREKAEDPIDPINTNITQWPETVRRGENVTFWGYIIQPPKLPYTGEKYCFEIVDPNGAIIKGYPIEFDVDDKEKSSIDESWKVPEDPVEAPFGLYRGTITFPCIDPRFSTTYYFNVVDTLLVIQKFNDTNQNGKVDSEDERLRGWEFKVTDPGGNTTTHFTNDIGEKRIKIPIGYEGKDYTIGEILKHNWTAITSTKQTKKVVEGKTTLFEFLNKPKPPTWLLIQKFNDTNQNGKVDDGVDERLRGWEFKVTDPGGNTTTHFTNDIGEKRIKIPIGYEGKVYTIGEILKHNWTAITSTKQTKKVVEGKTTLFEFLNKPKPPTWLLIQKFNDTNQNGKVDSEDERLRGWEFKVTDPDGKTTTHYTDDKGEIIIEIPREYERKDYIIEETVPPKWVSVFPIKQTVKGETTTVQFLNIPRPPTYLIIQKFNDTNRNNRIDGNDERLQGWKFNVTDPDKRTKTYVTDSNGERVIKIPEEYAGKEYTVEEILKDGWKAITPTKQTKNVPESKTTTVQFLNRPQGNLTIIKFCDHNQNGVQDPGDQGLAWNFSIKFPDGSVKRIRTYKNGSYLLPKIPVGNYEITEEPRGCRWTNSTDMTQKVEVKGGQETIAQFRNYIAECCILPGCVWKNSDENIEVCKSVDPCSVALGKEEEEVTIYLGICVDPKHIINGTKVENISVIDTLHSQFTIVDGSFSEEPNARRRNHDDTTTLEWDIPSLCCEEWNVSFKVTVAFALPIDVTDTSERITSKVIYEDPIETGRRELSIPEGTLKFIVTPPIWCYVLGVLLVISISIEITLELKRRKKEKPKEKE